MVENKSPIFFRSEFMPRVGLVHKKEEEEKRTKKKRPQKRNFSVEYEERITENRLKSHRAPE